MIRGTKNTPDRRNPAITTWDVQNPVNNGVNMSKLPIPQLVSLVCRISACHQQLGPDTDRLARWSIIWERYGWNRNKGFWRVNKKTTHKTAQKAKKNDQIETNIFEFVNLGSAPGIFLISQGKLRGSYWLELGYYQTLNLSQTDSENFEVISCHFCYLTSIWMYHESRGQWTSFSSFPSQGATKDSGGIALSADFGCRLVSIHLRGRCMRSGYYDYGGPCDYPLPSGKLTWLGWKVEAE